MTASNLTVEADALGRVCPHYIVTEEACIGRRCMAWRWVHDDPVDAYPSAESQGYCGLVSVDSLRPR